MVQVKKLQGIFRCGGASGTIAKKVLMTKILVMPFEGSILGMLRFRG